MSGRIRSAISVLFLLSALVLLPAATGRATTLVQMSLEQLSQASSDIVRGHVTSQESVWNPQHTEIITLTTVSVEQRVKGQAAQEMVIEQLGGKIGNFRVYVPGTVHFFAGAKYLLFLQPASANPAHYLVVGLSQGAYPIYTDPVTQQERVIRPLGARFYTNGVSAGQAIPLREFRRELQGAMEAQLVIPRGTLIPVTIAAATMRGVGRLELEGRTARDLFPTKTSAVPAGSVVEGAAEKEDRVWKVQWSDVTVRGRRVPIAATARVPVGESLRGQTLTATVQ